MYSLFIPGRDLYIYKMCIIFLTERNCNDLDLASKEAVSNFRWQIEGNLNQLFRYVYRTDLRTLETFLYHDTESLQNIFY